MKKSKKIALSLAFMMMLLGGCGQGTAVDPPFPVEENDCDDGQCETEVEEKAVGEIADGDDITRIALEKAITEQQVLVSQEVFEQVLKESVEEEAPKPLEATNPEAPPVYEVVEIFETEFPEDLILDLRYDQYPSSYNYLLVTTETLNVREAPSVDAEIINKTYYFEKVSLKESVRGQYIEKYDTDLWYRIFWKDGDEVKEGFVFSALAVPRTYQFQKMFDHVKLMKEEVDANTTAYISNYKNRNGTAPSYHGKTVDAYGTGRSQSAPAYHELSNLGEFRYLEDGTLITVLGKNETETHYQVRLVETGESFWVPRKYVSFSNSIEELSKVIVVDRENQNEGVFEFIDGSWHLISYIFATTGEDSQFKQPTSLGYWMAITTVPEFLYLDDITKEIAGYAPYAIRFNGGAYIHGVPVNFLRRNNQNVDPGMKEYLFTIGTVPRSHKCVRNYTSHAKFLYDWIEIGKSAFIVIE